MSDLKQCFSLFLAVVVAEVSTVQVNDVHEVGRSAWNLRSMCREGLRAQSPWEQCVAVQRLLKPKAINLLCGLRQPPFPPWALVSL